MEIIYLNFAANDDSATDNTVPKLKKKYAQRDQESSWNRLSAWWWGSSVIERVDAFGCIAEHQRHLSTPLGQDPGELQQYKQVQSQVRTFFRAHPNCSKIMVGMHGLYDDTTYGYSRPTRDAPRVAYDKAADIVLSLFGDHVGRRPIKLSLVMCYGARSAQYDVSHESYRLGGETGPDLSSSFAFKFYSCLCKYMNVKMSARTGAASFDDRTGASRVESELTLQHRIQMARNPFTPMEQQNLDQHRIEELDAFMNDLQPQATNAFDMAQVKEADRRGDEFAHNQLVSLQGNDPVTRAKREAAWSRFSQTPASKPMKSGKLTYEYEPDSHQVIIRCKYPQSRVVQRVNI